MVTCEKCKQEFKGERYLKQHLQRKTPCGVDYTCDKCQKSFDTAYLLNSHLKRKTPCVIDEIDEDVEEDTIVCEDCNKTFANMSNLRRHQREYCNGPSDSQNDMSTIQEVAQALEDISIFKQKFKEFIHVKESLQQENNQIQQENTQLKNENNALKQENEKLKLQDDSDDETYFIFKEDEDICKIGYSANPEKRLSNIQTGNEAKLEIYETIPGGKYIEGLLHQIFEPQLIRGEWYRITREQVDAVVDLINYY